MPRSRRNSSHRVNARRRRKGLSVFWRAMVWIGRMFVVAAKFAIASFGRRKSFHRNRNYRIAREDGISDQENRQLDVGPTRTTRSIARTIHDTSLVDATSALMNLGFRKSQAASAVRHAASVAGEGAEVSTLIRLGLRNLAK